MLTTLIVSCIYIGSPAIAVNVTGSAGMDTGQGKTVLNRFDPIPEGATVFTMSKSFVQIRLASGSQLRLGPDTTARLTNLEYATPRAKRREGVKLMVGRLWARVTSLFGNESKFEVETDNAVAGVRGTYILANAGDGSSSFYSINGSVVVTGGSGASVEIQSGLGVVAGSDGLGSAFTLSPSEVMSQLSNTAGPIGPIEVEVLSLDPWVLPATLTSTELRSAIVGPDQVVDTQLQAGQAGSTPVVGPGPVSGPSSVDVRVHVVPSRQ